MSVELYQTISAVTYILGGIMAVVSVFLFVYFRIGSVFRELNGTGTMAHKENTVRKKKPAVTFSIRISKKNEKKEEKVLPGDTEVLQVPCKTELLKDQDIVESLIVEDEIVFINTNEIIS